MSIKRRSTKAIGLNLTAMIDVVFLLLVYFMVATEFKTAEESFPMDLPVRQGGAVVLDREPLVIHVESVGGLQGDIRVRLDGPWGSLDSLYELSTFMKQHLVSSLNHDGLFASTHPVWIKPTKDTRWEHAVSAYNVVVNAAYTNITLDEPS